MLCLTPWGQGAVELLQHTAGGSGTPAYAPPHCMGAVGSATPAMHRLTAWGQWGVQILQRSASLPGGNGECKSCNTVPHCLGAVGNGTSPTDRHTLRQWGQWAVQLLQCTASLTVWGQWRVQLLQCTASLLGGSGQCNSCYALPHSLGAGGNGTSPTHRHTALGQWGQWVVQLLQCTASLTAWGQWTVQLLQCTASLPGGSGQWSCCNALPQCLGPVGSATPAMLGLTMLRVGGTGVHPNWWAQLTVRLNGIAAPIGAGPLAGGTGSPARESAAARRAPTGDGSPLRCGPTG